MNLRTQRSATIFISFMIVALIVLHSMPTTHPGDQFSVSGTPILSQDDTIRPEIYEWGLDGTVNNETSFVVWANVSDVGSGIKNVTANLRQDTLDVSEYIMSFNSTFYRVAFPPVESNHTYTIRVRAFDNANNSALSFPRSFDLRIIPGTITDPYVTLPIVVSSSLVLLVLVAVVAREYDKRHPREVAVNENQAAEEIGN
ncbi:MAG: hypothetical protein ACFFEF_08630 [Candidatus Thorarchaeota archaeon]